LTVEAVEVAWRDYDWQPLPAVKVGSVLMRNDHYHRHAGPRRWFWLVDEGVQLVYEPFGWSDEWYVDIVRFETRAAGARPGYRVIDEYVDVVVEGSGPTYRMIDLDELADALTAGETTADRAAEALRCAQRFVDRYLHRGAPFPPVQIREFFSADHRYPPLPCP
jgi:hypothetical protein